jgi:signal transduction histidine kinase
MQMRNHTLILKVVDNGIGISDDQIMHSDSLGLLGLRERAVLLGGDVSIKGTEGKGTVVTAIIPLEVDQ